MYLKPKASPLQNFFPNFPESTLRPQLTLIFCFPPKTLITSKARRKPFQRADHRKDRKPSHYRHCPSSPPTHHSPHRCALTVAPLHPPTLIIAAPPSLSSISALLIVVSVLTSLIRRELEELGVTLPKDAFELIFGQTPLFSKILATRLLGIFLANRHSAHRKLQYISKLERSVTSFQIHGGSQHSYLSFQKASNGKRI
ncbi:hypothetical protein Ahy_A03g012825 isoform B [Arachis hypogaea]|uniref:Uncharacterized protein n=1 Tax=Arachis hypogaea TaxID=3818 RepID=A0A445DU95_ARAHY|nr:hypothetical protein Ahy_A03g012825 isoform B [Arachis hypogaea]